MEHYEHRNPVRTVATLDSFLVWYTLWTPIVMKVLFAGEYCPYFTGRGPNKTEQTKPEYPMEQQERRNNSNTKEISEWFLGVVFVAAICAVIQVIAIVKLFQSTNIELDHVKAVKLARYWRNVTVVFTFLLTVATCTMFFELIGKADVLVLILPATVVAIRVHGCYHVQCYIIELDLTIEQEMAVIYNCIGTQPEVKICNWLGLNTEVEEEPQAGPSVPPLRILF